MRFLIKKSFHLGLAIVVLVMMCSLCFAFGGKVNYTDGTPAAGATVSLIDSNGVEQTTTCNANGKFQFAQLPEGDARVQINAPDGTNFAPVVLPAAVFESGETAIVL